MQTKGSHPPFFCVHPAGGTVFCYTALARQLGTDQPFYGLQSRGLNGEAAPHERIEDMAEEYVAAARSIQPSGPYYLGGWSIGGIVAFDMARQLEKAGEEVGLLALIDSEFPEKNPPQLDPVTFLIEFALHSGLDATIEELLPLSENQQLEVVLNKAKKAGLFPAEISVAEFSRVFKDYARVFQTNIHATRAYVPAASPRRVVLLRATQLAESMKYERKHEWTDLVSSVDMRLMPGDHYTILREPNVKMLAEHVAQCLYSLQARHRQNGSHEST
jgi:thioesterase domain-containing protein